MFKIMSINVHTTNTSFTNRLYSAKSDDIERIGDQKTTALPALFQTKLNTYYNLYSYIVESRSFKSVSQTSRHDFIM